MAPFEIPDSDEEEEPAFHPLAAMEGALGQDAGDGERPDAVRSGSTDPAFFQSVYDEHQEAIRQVSRATKPQAEKVADDPYDIPSSPEVSARKRKTKPRSSNPDEGHDQASSQRKRKRRRREGEDVDQVSLVKVPTQDDPSWNDPPASLDDGMPSTLDPLQALPQPQPVAPVAVMDSSGFVPTQDQGPLATGRGGLIKSSGSATNVNTPRSLPPSMPLDAATQENTAPKGTDPVWIDSSPDMLTTSMTPRPSRRGRNAASRVNQMTPVVEDGHPDEPEEAAIAPPEPESPGYTSNDEPVAKKPAKAKKKQRGRPRKNAAPEPVPEPAPEVNDEPDIINEAANAAPEEPSKETIPGEVPEEAPAQPAASKKPGKKPKKKRGRPKKSDKAVPIADTKPLEEAPPTQGAGQEDEQDVQEHKEPEPEPEPKRAKTPKNKRRGDDSDAFDPEGDTPAQKGKEEEEEETKAAIKTTPAIESKKALKANGTGPALMPGNKPIYRVGLSKRSRIAPLLKIVRKD